MGFLEWRRQGRRRWVLARSPIAFSSSGVVAEVASFGVFVVAIIVIICVCPLSSCLDFERKALAGRAFESHGIFLLLTDEKNKLLQINK